ncbi:MAG: hypothetical protein ACD_3C00058G0001 [uncultured bacterium (gcode 4)]|uniref:Uncharacterized protein n=1 Tax=uncultured bacterium (gcode 4) TaxID=1234023 RepID=K2GY82_9BACT|nr:MAG: hypothetical protein ACD_3C00058G0001 [uncultured bacterium (gcode 4)]
MSCVNGYQDGYKKGKEDGRNRQQKNNIVSQGILNAIGTTNPQEYSRTYSEGYDKGYVDGASS